MPGRVAGNVEHPKGEPETRERHLGALGERNRATGDVLARGPEHRHVGMTQQRLDAADVVEVVVGHEDRVEGEAAARERLEHRGGVARIDDGDAVVVRPLAVHQPDVVVGKCGDPGDAERVEGVPGEAALRSHRQWWSSRNLGRSIRLRGAREGPKPLPVLHRLARI